MIFVTVGTHEQGFDRLIKEVDYLKASSVIMSDVFIQKGFTTYIPQHCKFKDFLTYDEMKFYMSEADIVICHGGPATFMQGLLLGKKMIIVPRLKKFGEHVNDHQLDFLNQIKSQKISLTVVTDIKDLTKYLRETLDVVTYQKNTTQFCERLRIILTNLY